MSGRSTESRACDVAIKLLMVGESRVGKSSILLRYTDGVFQDNAKTTVGVDFKVKTIVLDNLTVKLSIWDTAGQERYRTLTHTYYRGAQGVLLVYDVTSPSSFERLQSWLDEINEHAEGQGKEVVKILVGNKIDQKREVSRATAEAYAQEHGMVFIETSAKTRVGIEQVFEELVLKILNRPTFSLGSAFDRHTVSLHDDEDTEFCTAPSCC